MWVYQHTESQLWTVGYYDPQGEWITEGDYDYQRDAAERAAWLNGETTYRSATAHDFAIKANARIAELEAQLQAQQQRITVLEKYIEDMRDDATE